MNFLRTRRTSLTIIAGAAIAVAAAVALYPGLADADLQEDPTVSVGDYEVHQSGSVDVSINLDPKDATVAGFQGYLSFDSETLRLVDCEVLAGSGVCNTEQSGRLPLIAFDPVDGWDDRVDLATVTFEALATSGSSELAVTVEELAGSNGRALEHASQNGSISVIAQSNATGSITGDVTDVTTEIGVYGIQACATGADSVEYCIDTNSWGAYRIDDVPTGEYWLNWTDPQGRYLDGSSDNAVKVSADTIATGVDVYLAPSDMSAAADEPTSSNDDQPFALSTGVIAGLVVAPDGVAVMGAEVCAKQPLLRFEACTLSQLGGDFEIAIVSSGNYFVSATDPVARYAASEPLFVGLEGDRLDGLEIHMN